MPVVVVFLAPTYHLDDLCQMILQVTGTQVALHFHSITDSQPGQMVQMVLQTKAIHIEVGQTKPKQIC